MKTLVVVLGPTGVGKTELCLQIARHLGTPIINADSRQIFSELPIGTAAPTLEQQRSVPHYFVGIHHIQDYYSASKFENDVIDLLQNHLFPISETTLMTGGSMMYIDAVCDGIDDIPTVNEETRSLMKARLIKEGLPALAEELRMLDPDYYALADKNNPRRIVHALEICHMTGKPYSFFRTNSKKERPFKILKIGLNRPREELYERINERVLQMMQTGLEEEARNVYSLKGINALNTVGYKELFDYFDGNINKDEAIRQIQSNSRRYMRQQLTWFKKDDCIRWFNPENSKEIINYIDASI